MAIWDAGSGGPIDAVRFSSSWILPPSILFFLRALFSIFIFVSIFTILGLDVGDERGQYFSYFTSLVFFGLAFYFAFAALHTGSYWLTGKPLLARWPKVLQFMHSILYSTVTTFPFLVTIVYWGILYNSLANGFDVFREVSQHILNSVFALFEILISRTAPTPWIDLLMLIVILALYLGLAYITVATQHFYVYGFLNDHIHSHGVVAGYIFGIAAAVIVVFLIVHFVILLRQWITEKKLGKLGNFSIRKKDIGTTDTEMGEEHKVKTDK